MMKKIMLERYVDEVLPGLREEIEEFKITNADENKSSTKRSVSEAIKATNAKILINSIKIFILI